MPISKAGTSTDGFTLAELVVVILIISLAIGLAIPLLGGDRRADLHAAGRRLAGVVKHYYNESALSGAPHRLSLNLDRAGFRVERQQRGGEWQELGGSGREQRLAGDVRISEVFITGRGGVTSGTATVQIYSAGWVDGAVIYLRDDEAEMTLRISSLTGVTEFFDGHREFR